MKRVHLVLIAMLATATPALSQVAPTKVRVPAHRVWCATSAPVAVAGPGQSGGAEEGRLETEADQQAKLIHSALFDRIQREAIEAGLLSLGIPYADELEDLTPAPPAAARPATGPGAEEHVDPLVPPDAPVEDPRTTQYRVTICTAVQPDAPAAPAGIAVREVATREVYAAHCPVDREPTCRDALAARLRAEGIAIAEGEEKEIEWRVRQSLTADGSDAAVVAALSDHRLRELSREAPVVDPPIEFAIFWMPVEEARRLGAPAGDADETD